jgi:hypothetical protein
MNALYRLYSAYPLMLGWKRRGGGASAPDAVTNLVAVAGDEVVNLTWDASVGATGYKVYRNTTNNFGSATEVIESPTAEAALDVYTALQLGELYYFWVVATNAVGDSPESASDSARPYVTLASPEDVNLTTPAGSWILSTLFFRTGGNLPANCIVVWDGGLQGGLALGDGTWEDAFNGGTFDPAISGAFNFDNQSGGSVTFWDTEPA